MPLTLNDAWTNCNILISRRFHLGCYFAIFQGQKVNFKVKHDFSENNARNTCDTSFQCDFELNVHHRIILRIGGHFQCQKVNLKVKSTIMK